MRFTRGCPNKFYMRAFGVILPDGNKDEFPYMKAALTERKIAYSEIKLKGGGMVIFFSELDRRKLPSWDRKRYIPTHVDEDGTESGHGIYQITPFILADLLR